MEECENNADNHPGLVFDHYFVLHHTILYILIFCPITLFIYYFLQSVAKRMRKDTPIVGPLRILIPNGSELIEHFVRIPRSKRLHVFHHIAPYIFYGV